MANLILDGSFDSVFSDHLVECEECDLKCEETALTQVASNDNVCSTCLENYVQCDWTNEWFPENELTEVGGIHGYNIPSVTRERRGLTRWGRFEIVVCQDALDDEFTSCYACDEYALINACHSFNYSSVCESCYDSDYFTCGECGDLFHNDDYGSEGECERCSDARTENCDDILSYGTDVTDHLSFLGNSRDGIYFGVELEVQTPDLSEDVQITLELMSGFALLKSDSTVDDGFEIVSAPATMDVHRDRWGKFLDKRPSSMTSYQSGACGMHVHVSRSPLSQLTIGKILVLLNSHTNTGFVRAIAGRTSDKYAQVKTYKKIVDGRKRNDDRYEALNLQNRDTIEFRIFRGTLDKRHFMANLEFVHSCVYYCMESSMQHLHYKDLMTWVRRQGKPYRNLIEFMESKGY